MPESKERKFIHDLSNRLAIAYGLVDVMIDEGKQAGSLDEQQLSRLERVRSNLERMKDLMKSRRQEIIEDEGSGQA